MDVAFTHLTWWLCSRKIQRPGISNGSSMNSSADSSMWESDVDVLRFPSVKQANVPSTSRRVKAKWHSREEQKIDREYDVVLVPSDSGCISDSESDDSDWSIGWLEPQGAGFSTDDDDESNEADNSFAVLVPCYGRNYGGMVKEDPKSNLLSKVGNLPDSYSDESRKYVENWLSSLRNS